MNWRMSKALLDGSSLDPTLEALAVDAHRKELSDQADVDSKCRVVVNIAALNGCRRYSLKRATKICFRKSQVVQRCTGTTAQR